MLLEIETVQSLQWKWPEIDHVLSGNAEHRSAGDQQAQPRADAQEIGNRFGSRQNLLEVVQHQQIVAVSQRALETFEHRAAGCLHAQLRGDRGEHQLGLLHVGEIDKIGGIARARNRLDGRAGFADSPWFSQGDDGDVVAIQQAVNRTNLSTSPDK